NSCYDYQGEAGSPGGVVLWVGTVKPLKRPELFLDLAQRLPHLRFRLIGGGAAGPAPFDALGRRAQALCTVEVTGFGPPADVERHFDGASILVNTSIGEGFPNTFLQAWARGIPTVSFFDTGASSGGRAVGRVTSDIEAMISAVDALTANAQAWR